MPLEFVKLEDLLYSLYMKTQSPLVYTLLKIKVYWHLWFYEELLTSMEPFHWAKGSLEFLNVLTLLKKYIILRTVH